MDKRQQIMQAAEAMFTSRRFHEITLDEVAASAKVGKGTIYRYFADKDELFFQIATSGFEELCELVRQKVPRDVGFAEQLLEVCTQISGFFRRRRQLFRMMDGVEGRMAWCGRSVRAQWNQKRKLLLAAMGERIRAGLAEGKVRCDVEAEVLAGVLLGMLRTWAREGGDRSGVGPGQQLVVDLFLNGAGRNRPGAGKRGPGEAKKVASEAK
jgi:AcrR family transcriptional regulator